jgi:16S rRNA (guanine966-N2)-methyltransferase
MKAHIRIVGGQMRGRKLTCNVTPELRPTPDMVREALFNILGNAVPDQVFVDVFAGTGVVGMEALSRGAKQTIFVERDVRTAGEIERHLKEFKIDRQARVYRTDVYRWASHWQPPAEPVNVFFSPPFADLGDRTDDLVNMIADLQIRTAPGSVLVLQAEKNSAIEVLPIFNDWEKRKYSRNLLYLWQEQEAGEPSDVCCPSETTEQPPVDARPMISDS